MTDQDIKEGTVIWEFTPGLDIKIDKDKLETNLTGIQLEFFLKYAYLNDKESKYVLCCDDARFFNHSENPNVIEVTGSEEGIDIASRDIKFGEELTVDYRGYDGVERGL